MINSSEQLAAIRKDMSAALHCKDHGEYHRLGAEHRRILHAANPEVKLAWEASRARSGGV